MAYGDLFFYIFSKVVISEFPILVVMRTKYCPGGSSDTFTVIWFLLFVFFKSLVRDFTIFPATSIISNV